MGRCRQASGDRTARLQQAPGREIPADAGEVRTQRLVQRCGAGGEAYEGCNGVIAPHGKLHAHRAGIKAEVGARVAGQRGGAGGGQGKPAISRSE
ncbi:hypothetical protein A7X61_15585 [Stenotrophomonas maltophilia]|nr:hypothetical protein A7X61_15585 [Stenotrophomonas maltophilia]PZS93861.1 hypothetical protein A7X66_13435 [Stenotrophomonas maltophilia]